ncbi:MAG: cation:dicarboxylate symporter family transporter [Pseudanabaenaceae cyanobacterium]
MNLSVLIFASLLVGILFGGVVHELYPSWVYPLDHYFLSPLGQVFLKLIQFVVVPIVFCSLLMGLSRVKSGSQISRYILKLFSSYLCTSAIAISFGLLTVMLIQTGTGIAGLTSAEIITTSSSRNYKYV